MCLLKDHRWWTVPGLIVARAGFIHGVEECGRCGKNRIKP